MFNRCYSDTYHIVQPTYIGCGVSEEFHNFQNFALWYNKIKYDCKYDLELDKDFLYEGNKIYSPATCCLLPTEINSNLNVNRHNCEHMKYLYDKYKNDIPYRLRMELYKLTKRGA